MIAGEAGRGAAWRERASDAIEFPVSRMQLTHRPRSGPDTPVPDAEREAVRAVLQRLGLAEAARRIGCTTETLSRFALGASVRRGSVLVIRQGLQLLAEGPATALAPMVAELLANEAHGGQLVDVVRAVPAPKRAVMRACREGRIAGAVRVARRWLAPRQSIETWVRSMGPRAVPAPKGEQDDLEEARASLARPGRRRRAG